MARENISAVYKITNPKGQIYVGSSKNLHKRVWFYNNMRHSMQPKLYKSYLKYGVKGHKIEILEICNVKDLKERESYHGVILNCCSGDNLNFSIPKTKYTKDLNMSIKKLPYFGNQETIKKNITMPVTH